MSTTMLERWTKLSLSTLRHCPWLSAHKLVSGSLPKTFGTFLHGVLPLRIQTTIFEILLRGHDSMYQRLDIRDADDHGPSEETLASAPKAPLCDTGDAGPTECRHLQWPTSNFWYYAGALVLLSVMSVVVLLKVEAATKAADCGSSVSEARSKGCQFEPMQRAWIPKQCYFSEPADEYAPFSDRTWFLDATLTTQADPNALEMGDVPVAYVANFHQEHCTYNWRKLAIAVSTKARWIDDRVGKIHHATHCALGLAEQTKNMSSCGEVSAGSFTRSNLNFLKCQRLY